MIKPKLTRYFHEISISTLIFCFDSQNITYNMLHEIFFLKFNRFILDIDEYNYIINEYTDFFNYLCNYKNITFKHVGTSTYMYTSNTESSYKELKYKYSSDCIEINMLMCIMHSDTIDYRTLCNYFKDYYMEYVNIINDVIYSKYPKILLPPNISYSSEGILYANRLSRIIVSLFVDISANKIRQYKLDFIEIL